MSETESPSYLILILGSLGLALALLFLVFRKKKKAPAAPEALEAKSPDKILSPSPAKVSQASPNKIPSPSPEKLSPAAAPPKTQSWWSALSKTRERFFRSSSQEIQEIRNSLEEACLVSDLGVSNTQEALASLNWKELSELPESERVARAKVQLAHVIRPWIQSAQSAHENWLAPEKTHKPTVIWFVGVNGVGKTTSIAKLGYELKSKGSSVIFAAGDTFRAAAGEQLEIWAQRLDITCIRGQAGADSSAVLFDAIQSAKAKNIDFVLCDSAGRLHNQNQLIDALKKNKRVMEKALPGSPHEVLLVLDANTGQNMLSQAEGFLSAVGVTGLILTKLDGTARGGAVIAVARKTGLPIRRLGLGENQEAFVSFDADQFSEALLGASTLQK